MGNYQTVTWVCACILSHVWHFCNPLNCSLPDSKSNLCLLAGKFFTCWTIIEINILIGYLCMLSLIWLFETPWTVPPGSSVHGILQTSILEWGAISFFRRIFPTQELNLSPALTGGSFTTMPPGKLQYFDNNQRIALTCSALDKGMKRNISFLKWAQ